MAARFAVPDAVGVVPGMGAAVGTPGIGVTGGTPGTGVAVGAGRVGGTVGSGVAVNGTACAAGPPGRVGVGGGGVKKS